MDKVLNKVGHCLQEGPGPDLLVCRSVFSRCSSSSSISGLRPAVMLFSNWIVLFLPQHTPNLLQTDHPNLTDP